MKRGATPTNTFDVDIDLTQAHVWVTYSQGGQVIIEKTGEDLTVTESSIACSLSQEETLALAEGAVEIQIAYVTATGQTDKSDIIQTDVERILKDEVLAF